MDIVHTSRELMERIEKLDEDHSVCQVFIPGKGKVTIVLQATDKQTIASEVQADAQLVELIQSSRNAYQRGDSMTTSELLNSLSLKDFSQ